MVFLTLTQIELAPDGRLRRYLLRPNCSCSWRATRWFIFGVAVQAALVSAVFWSQGLIMILPFAGLEALAVAAGLYAVSRKSHSWESVIVGDRDIEVARGGRRKRQSWRFPLHRVVFDLRPAGRPGDATRLGVRCAGSPAMELEIGRFLSGNERRALHGSLSEALGVTARRISSHSPVKGGYR